MAAPFKTRTILIASVGFLWVSGSSYLLIKQEQIARAKQLNFDPMENEMEKLKVEQKKDTKSLP